MFRTVCLLLGVCLSLFAMLPSGYAVEVKEKDLPKAVAKAIKDRYPMAKITEIDKETDNGKTFFTITLTQKGPNLDVTVTEKGEITHVEKELDVKDLPKPVTKAIEEKYPKGKIEIAGEVYVVKNGKDELEHYDLIVKAADKKVWQVEINAAGKILKNEEFKD